MTRKDVIQEMTARTNEKYNEMLEAEGKLADKDKFHRRDVTAFFAALEELVTEAKGDKVPVPGLGYFTKRHVNTRSGVMKGVAWEKPEHDELTFKIDSAVKEL